MRSILLPLATAACFASQQPRTADALPPERSAGWIAGGISGGVSLGALTVGGGFVFATEGRESGDANGIAVGVGAIAGGVAGYFIGRCARNDADGTTCRIATIVMNALGFGAPTTFVFVGAAAAGGGGH